MTNGRHAIGMASFFLALNVMGADMKYDIFEIAKRIQDTANGKYYDGNSLRVAKDIPFLDRYDRSVLDAYLTGTHTRQPFHYSMRIQDIAIKIRELGEKDYGR